jgi:hypothetical protein
VPQAPMVAAGELGGSTLPALVSISIGTSMAMALTAQPETLSVADARRH